MSRGEFKNIKLYEEEAPFYKKKKFLIPLFIIIILVVLRVMAPVLILDKINAELKEFSPTLTAKVEDLDLKLYKGQVELEGITADIKESNRQFLKIDSVIGTVELRDLLKGDVVLNSSVNKFDLTYSKGLMDAVKEHLEAQPKEDKKPTDIRVAKVDVKDSLVRFDPYPSLTGKRGVILSEIDARATNVLPTEDLPKTVFVLKGTLLDSGELKTSGEALTEADPVEWTIDSELLDFDLTTLNPFLYKNVPITFTKGNIDLFTEAKSQDGEINGYLKPFVNNLDVLRTKEEFKNVKHWFFEFITAISNITMQEDGTAATKVPFVMDETLKTDTGESIQKAFTHAFLQELSRGIENSINLNGKDE